MDNLIISHILDHLTCVSVCIFSITAPSWKNTDREERDSCFLVKLLALKNWRQGKRPIQKCVTKHFTIDLGALLWEEKGKKKDFEQRYWLMGLCIYNSFPFTTPSRAAEHKLNFTCASNSYIILWQIISQQGTDHKAATKNTYSSKEDIREAIKATIILPPTVRFIISKCTSVNLSLFVLSRSSWNIHFCSMFLVT